MVLQGHGQQEAKATLTRVTSSDQPSCSRAECANGYLVPIGLASRSLLVATIAFGLASNAGAQQTRLERLLLDPERLAGQLDRRLDSNSRDEDGAPLLAKAIQLKQPVSFRLLLARGADPKHRDTRELSSWYYALVDESDAYLDALSGRSQLPELDQKEFLRGIDALRKNGKLSIRMSLLTAGSIDVNSALLAVAEAGILEAIDPLIAAGAQAEALSYDALNRFLESGREPYLDALLSAGANANARDPEGRSLLYDALALDNITAVPILLTHGAEVQADKPKHDPLLLALFKGYTGVAVELVRRGRNPNELRDGRTAVDVAELMQDIEFLRHLETLEPRPEQSTTNTVALALRELGLLRVETESPEWTPALTAATRAFQVSHGLPPHGHPSIGTDRALRAELAPIYLQGAEAGRTDLVIRLLQHFPELESVTDSNGWDALMHAAFAGSASTVNFLLSQGAKVDRVDSLGSTALLLAVTSISVPDPAKQQVVSALVSAGADPHRVNNESASAAAIGQYLGGWLADSLDVPPLTAPATPLVAVMGRPNGATRYTCKREWPNEDVERWWNDEGLSILNVGTIAGLWCVVMGNDFTGKASEQYRWISSITQLQTALDEASREGKTLWDLATKDGRTVVVFRKTNRGGRDGWLWTTTGGFEAIAQKIWSEGHTITNVVSYNSQLLVTYGSTRGYVGPQGWARGDLDYVLTAVAEKWRAGAHLTSMAKVGDQWVAVASRGSDLKDQTIVVGANVQDLNAKLNEKGKDGWRMLMFVEDF
jgi:uncharacterized protein